jgi:ribosomal protein S12 methylthiotransferase accessory factor
VRCVRNRKGWRSFRELVRALNTISIGQIHEALTRLLDRRYILPASRSSDSAVAAYWASPACR